MRMRARKAKGQHLGFCGQHRKGSSDRLPLLMKKDQLISCATRYTVTPADLLELEFRRTRGLLQCLRFRLA